MVVLQWTYLVGGGLVGLFFGLFAFSSIGEKRSRALAVSVASLGGFAVLWFGWFALCLHSPVALAAPLLALGFFLILFYAPLGRDRAIAVGELGPRVDERDVMFSREEYLPGSDKYDRYYTAHPELKEVDDRLRQLPVLFAPGGRYYDENLSAQVSAVFRQIEDLTPAVDGAVADRRRAVDTDEITRDLKDRLRQLGADEVGAARLNPMFVYSHVGRGPEPWGKPIETTHEYVLAFSLEMKYDSVETAPTLPITEETARRYLRAAEISIELARHIRSLGYSARAHIAGSNYQIVLPPVAQDCGLGELGRIGYLISPRFGARIRLGAITTELPLIPDRPVSFGLQDFCDKCVKCAANCPSAAIPGDGPTPVRGVQKWPLKVEQCLHYWRLVGTDCGVCMKVCPFSHPPTMVHNIVRAGIRRSAFARTVSVWGDDLFYGRKADNPRA